MGSEHERRNDTGDINDSGINTDNSEPADREPGDSGSVWNSPLGNAFEEDVRKGPWNNPVQKAVGEPPEYQEPLPERNDMSTASMVMGILSLVCCCCTWIGIVFGILGIVFALMSKRGGWMNSEARVGRTLSIIGIVLDILVVILFVSLQVLSLLPDLGMQH